MGFSRVPEKVVLIVLCAAAGGCQERLHDAVLRLVFSSGGRSVFPEEMLQRGIGGAAAEGGSYQQIGIRRKGPGLDAGAFKPGIGQHGNLRTGADVHQHGIPMECASS